MQRTVFNELCGRIVGSARKRATHATDLTGTQLLVRLFVVTFLLLTGSLSYGQTYTYSVVHSFQGSPTGYNTGDEQYSWMGPVAVGTDGFVYGTTARGGIYNGGTLFRIGINGTGFKVLRIFNGEGPGALILGKDGLLYGVAASAIFQLRTDGTGFRTIHYFKDEALWTCIIQGVDGRLYGTSVWGGPFGGGIVFGMQTDGTRYSVIHAFGGNDDPNGSMPNSTITQGRDGKLYGTTARGGTGSQGTVFAVQSNGSRFSVIHRFDGGEGTVMQSQLVAATDGYLYGTTVNGNVFRISTNGSSYSLLRSFDGWTEGSNPIGLIQAKDGLLYGTCMNNGPFGGGTVFRMHLDGSDLRVVHAFSGGNGYELLAPEIQGPDGRLYGITNGPGKYRLGSVFVVKPDGSGFQDLLDFSAGDGFLPPAGVVLGRDGALYGTTKGGGAYNSGTVFRVTTDGKEFKTLHGFDGVDGSIPLGGGEPGWGVMQGQDGLLYGMSWSTIYRLDTGGGGFQVLAQFGGYGGLTQSEDGSLYGAIRGTEFFKMKPDGTGLVTFNPFNTGEAGVYGALAWGGDGWLYGTANLTDSNMYGCVFKVSSDLTSFKLIHNFSGSDGARPWAGVILGNDGMLYGNCYLGSTGNGGNVYKLNTNGTAFDAFYIPNGGPGSAAMSGLMQGSDSLLYGVGAGFAYSIDTSGGNLNVIHHFNSPAEGDVDCPLVRAADGTLYGTSMGGGEYGLGNVFKLSPVTLAGKSSGKKSAVKLPVNGRRLSGQR